MAKVMVVVVQVRKRGSVGIAYLKEFLVELRNAPIVNDWQEQYGEQWELMGHFRSLPCRKGVLSCFK